MGMYDRDWYREDYKRREKEYGGDFSLHSKRVKPSKVELSPIEQELKKIRNNRKRENILTAIICPILVFVATYVSLQNPPAVIAIVVIELILMVRALDRRRKYKDGFIGSVAFISSMCSLGFSIFIAAMAF